MSYLLVVFFFAGYALHALECFLNRKLIREKLGMAKDQLGRFLRIERELRKNLQELKRLSARADEENKRTPPEQKSGKHKAIFMSFAHRN